MPRVVLVACLALSTVAASAAWSTRSAVTQQVAAGVIAGVIVDAVTAAPVAGAAVTVSATRRAVSVEGHSLDVDLNEEEARRRGSTVPQRTITAADGSFSVSGLLPGRYLVAARHSAYFSIEFGRDHDDGASRLVALGPGERATGLVVRAWKPGTVDGRVVDERGDAVVDVGVTALKLIWAGGRARYDPVAWVNTNDNGQYRFPMLRPGSYVVSARSAIATVPLRTARLLAGASDNEVDSFHLTSARAGAPVPAAGDLEVGASLIRWLGPEGRIEDSSPEQSLTVYRTTLHAGATALSSAIRIEVESGSVKTGADVLLSPTATVAVSGSVRGPEGPLPNSGARLTSADLDGLMLDDGFEAAWTATDAEGRFTFLGVPPGRYRAVVRVATNYWAPAAGRPGFALSLTPAGNAFRPPARPAGEPFLWADSEVDVPFAGVTNLILEARAGLRLTGRFEFRGSAQMPTAAERALMFVTLRPIDRTSRFVGAVAPSRDTFSTAAHEPGRYEVEVRHPNSTWSVTGIHSGGRDLLDESLVLRDEDVEDAVVVLTDTPSSLVGGIERRSGPDGPPLQVVVFPSNVEAWIAGGMVKRVSWIEPADRDHFAFPLLLPGEYCIAAVWSKRRLDLQDPAFVRTVAARASRVTIRPGENRSPLLRPFEVGR